MSTDVLIALGLTAAALQIAGYSLYIRNFLKHAIRPNAASFMMFSYGTSLLAFLEWRSAASATLLLLPLVCAVMGIMVALLCLRRGATEPIDRFEAVAFTTDLWLTVIYAYFALGYGDAIRFAPLFLIATNLTTITCFVPIIRSTWKTPRRELPEPWMVWSGAYGILGIATMAVDQGRHPVLLLYPLMNFALHALIAVLAVRRVSTSRRYIGRHREIFIAPSRINGVGMFAGKSIGAKSLVWKLNGKLLQNPPQSDPNWIGIGPNCWINPNEPLNRINHSCDPNAAFGRRLGLYALRDIRADEEITIDYSTTETDPKWTMECHCKAPGCRRGLHAIQISFADQEAPPSASPLMQLVWHKRRVKPSGLPAFPQFDVPSHPIIADPISYVPLHPNRSHIGARRRERERARAA
jgi:SET domain